MKRSAWLNYFLAAAIGVGYAYLAAYFWAYYVFDNPINNWLLDAYAKQGRETTYYTAIYSHDFIVNFLIAIPFAIVVANLVPNSFWPYLGVALTGSLAVLYGGALLNADFWTILFTSKHAWASPLISFLTLPAAFAVAVHLRRRLGPQ
jgi:small basic protein